MQKIMFPARLSCLLVADGAAFSFYGYPSVLVCINSLFSLISLLTGVFTNVSNVFNDFYYIRCVCSVSVGSLVLPVRNILKECCFPPEPLGITEYLIASRSYRSGSISAMALDNACGVGASSAFAYRSPNWLRAFALPVHVPSPC